MSIFATQSASTNIGTPYYTGPGGSGSTTTLLMRSGTPYITTQKTGSSGFTGFMYAASALASLSQTISQSLALKSMAKAQKQAFEINKSFAELQAKDAIWRGNREATIHAKKVKKLIGSQRANLAAQGIEVNADSALDIQIESAEFGAIDVETIRNNAYREAWGYKVQALDLGMKGSMAMLSGESQARNTLLTGGLNTLNLGLDYYRRSSIEDYLK